jgi:hypothetical protein
MTTIINRIKEGGKQSQSRKRINKRKNNTNKTFRQ